MYKRNEVVDELYSKDWKSTPVFHKLQEFKRMIADGIILDKEQVKELCHIADCGFGLRSFDDSLESMRIGSEKTVYLKPTHLGPLMNAISEFFQGLATRLRNPLFLNSDRYWKLVKDISERLSKDVVREMEHRIKIK